MKCPNCGAKAVSKFCEYCCTKLGNDTENGYQPFTYNYNYHYTNNYGQPFAANTGKYANHEESERNRHNPSAKQHERADSNRSEKNLLICLILCILWGLLGVHRFYVGKVGTGILYIFTGGLFGLGYAIDLILIICGAFKDRRGKTLRW